jgi:polysaccharide pyruvyl transferase WcaK-like protein
MTMAAFVCWLCEQGYDVRLLIGDFHYDIRATGDVIGAIKRRFVEEGRVVAQPAMTIEEIMRQLDEADLVISPRFHNLVLSRLSKVGRIDGWGRLGGLLRAPRQAKH